MGPDGEWKWGALGKWEGLKQWGRGEIWGSGEGIGGAGAMGIPGLGTMGAKPGQHSGIILERWSWDGAPNPFTCSRHSVLTVTSLPLDM